MDTQPKSISPRILHQKTYSSPRFEALYSNGLKKDEQKQKLYIEHKKAVEIQELNSATFHPQINQRSRILVF